jgi:hypothetical protein
LLASKTGGIPGSPASTGVGVAGAGATLTVALGEAECECVVAAPGRAPPPVEHAASSTAATGTTATRARLANISRMLLSIRGGLRVRAIVTQRSDLRGELWYSRCAGDHGAMTSQLSDAADRLEALAARTTPGEWRVAGLLATRPEVLAQRPDGGSVHVAEARADSAAWIAALSPAVAAPLGALLRALAAGAAPREAEDLARALLSRLP